MEVKEKTDIKQEPFADLFPEVKTEDVENLQLLPNECYNEIKEEIYQETSHGLITPTFKKIKDEPQEVAGTFFSIEANSHPKCYNCSDNTNIKAGSLHTDYDLPTVKSKHFNPLVDHTYSKLPKNPDTCSIEYISNPQCFSYFTGTSNIKGDTVALKDEFLHTECDIPTVKNENYSTDNYNSLDQSKNGLNDAKRQKFKKNYSFSVSRLKYFNANFWKRWQACEFCGHFYNKLNYFGHYFIHCVQTNATNLLNCKTNKPSTLKTHVNSNKWKTRSKHERNRFVVKNSAAFRCELCFKEFTRKDKLKVHLKIHTCEKSYKCNICSKQFTKKSSLINHLRIHIGDKLFKCKTCLKQFTQKSSLNLHLKIHTGEKSYKCNICSKQFIQKTNLIHHIKCHTGEKPFKCETCLKQFTQKSNLNVHLKIHTGEKPYKCYICLKQFLRKTDLHCHLIIHTGEKPFKCKTCSKQFAQKSGLHVHLKSHTGEKPYKCNICSVKFTQKVSLNYHVTIHTGEKPFKCKNCLKQFAQKSRLNLHLKCHNGEEPSTCYICSKKFTNKKCLNYHLILHTDNKLFM